MNKIIRQTISLEEIFQNHIFFAVKRIIIPCDVDTSKVSVGTGLLVKVDLENKRQLVFLISNRHVFESTNAPFNYGITPFEFSYMPFDLHFHKKKQEIPRLNEITNIRINDYKNNIFGHPDESVDLAAIDISRYLHGAMNDIYFLATNVEQIFDFSRFLFYAGDMCSFLGFPEGFIDNQNKVPIMRQGCVASIPQFDFDGREEFLIDASVYHGSSGSPVFYQEKREDNHDYCHVIGIVCAAKYKSQTLSTGETLQQFVELGHVIKSTRLLELIDSILIRYNLKRSNE
jgi:hypothetical protein